MNQEVLELALNSEHRLPTMTLRQQHVADLQLPSGRLVAADPFVSADAQPFVMKFPAGTYPVILSIAHIKDDQRVAFATIRFRDASPTSWTMLTTSEDDLSKLKPDVVVGYPVDSGTGCFADFSAMRSFESAMSQDEQLANRMMAEMQANYVDTWDWISQPFANANLVAFSSGYGDGVYATYAGLDSTGEVCVIVTDFSVAELEDPAGADEDPKSLVSRLLRWLGFAQ